MFRNSIFRSLKASFICIQNTHMRLSLHRNSNLLAYNIIPQICEHGWSLESLWCFDDVHFFSEMRNASCTCSAAVVRHETTIGNICIINRNSTTYHQQDRRLPSLHVPLLCSVIGTPLLGCGSLALLYCTECPTMTMDTLCFALQRAVTSQYTIKLTTVVYSQRLQKEIGLSCTYEKSSWVTLKFNPSSFISVETSNKIMCLWYWCAKICVDIINLITVTASLL